MLRHGITHGFDDIEQCIGLIEQYRTATMAIYGFCGTAKIQVNDRCAKCHGFFRIGGEHFDVIPQKLHVHRRTVNGVAVVLQFRAILVVDMIGQDAIGDTNKFGHTPIILTDLGQDLAH